MFFKLLFRYEIRIVVKLLFLTIIFNTIFLSTFYNEILSIITLVCILPISNMLCMRDGIYFDESYLITTTLSHSKRLLYCISYNLFSLNIISLFCFLCLSILEHFNLITIAIGINIYLTITTILTIAEHFARRYATISIVFKFFSSIIIVIPIVLYALSYKRYCNLSYSFNTYHIHIFILSLLGMFCTYALAIMGIKYQHQSKWHHDSYIVEKFNKNYWY